MASTQQPKPVKLRESCDSCLLAKVKCSKSRPLCSRCLANGAPCDYSPSSRSGKRNRNGNTANKGSNNPQPVKKSSNLKSHRAATPDPAQLTRLMYPLLDEHDRNLLNQSHGSLMEDLASSMLVHEASRRPSDSGPSIQTTAEDSSNDSSEFLPTPPFSNMDYGETFMPMGSGEGDFLPDASESSFWPSIHGPQPMSDRSWQPKANPHFRDTSLHSPLDFIQMDSGPFAGHVPPQTGFQVPPHRQTNPNTAQHTGDTRSTQSPCDCFAMCLQVMQSLHSHSMLISGSTDGSPPFDVILTINREAIESCSSMLACSHCVFKSGRSVSTMMLATIFGKVISLYRATCHLCIKSSSDFTQSPVQLAFGAYTVTEENRQLLEIEILLLELKKLERTLERYSERFQTDNSASSPSNDDEIGVYGALTSYLEKNLQQIVEFLQKKKEEVQIERR